MPPRTLLLTSTISSPFVDEDARILGRLVQVNHLSARGIRGAAAILARAPRAGLTYTWFASVYAALAVAGAKLGGRPSVVVVGGVDVARHPEIGYGLWVSPWKGLFSGFALRNATRVLVVDPSLARLARERASYDGGNIRWVPTGYDATAWTPSGSKAPRVLTVASCATRGRVLAKGLDFLARTAFAMPDVGFRIIGIAPSVESYVRSFVPANVELLPPLPRSDLLAHYRESKVYCQPSRSEGLPNCLCEAMLCACVPVGTDAGGIPTAMGETGERVPFGEADTLRMALRRALHAPASAGRAARERIAAEFTLERRERALADLLEELL